MDYITIIVHPCTIGCAIHYRLIGYAILYCTYIDINLISDDSI